MTAPSLRWNDASVRLHSALVTMATLPNTLPKIPKTPSAVVGSITLLTRINEPMKLATVGKKTVSAAAVLRSPTTSMVVPTSRALTFMKIWLASSAVRHSRESRTCSIFP